LENESHEKKSWLCGDKISAGNPNFVKASNKQAAQISHPNLLSTSLLEAFLSISIAEFDQTHWL
jgi:hypothetical protein